MPAAITSRVVDQAHLKAVKTSFPDIVDALEKLLGQSLVAYLAGVDVRTVDRWTGDQNPRKEAEEKVRTAFQAAELLKGESDHIIRAWFIGLHPQLDDVSPARALRDGLTREVLVAARSFTLGG